VAATLDWQCGMGLCLLTVPFGFSATASRTASYGSAEDSMWEVVLTDGSEKAAIEHPAAAGVKIKPKAKSTRKARPGKKKRPGKWKD
jgi:hypothetical protein